MYSPGAVAPLLALAGVNGGIRCFPSPDGDGIDTFVVVFVIVAMIWDECDISQKWESPKCAPWGPDSKDRRAHQTTLLATREEYQSVVNTLRVAGLNLRMH